MELIVDGAVAPLPDDVFPDAAAIPATDAPDEDLIDVDGGFEKAEAPPPIPVPEGTMEGVGFGFNMDTIFVLVFNEVDL